MLICNKVNKLCGRGFNEPYENTLLTFKKLVLKMKLNSAEAKLVNAYLFSLPAMAYGLASQNERLVYQIPLRSIKRISMSILQAFNIHNVRDHRDDILEITLENMEIRYSFSPAPI
jgi:hypothetical protein